MARLPAELVERLHERHRLAQNRLLDATAALLDVRLRRLEDLGDEQAALYVADAVPVVARGQQRAAELAAGYVRVIATSDPERRQRPLELEPELVTPETPWMLSPIIRARRELAVTELEGPDAWTAALGIAVAKMRGYVSGDLATAQRHGLERGADASGLRVRGYRKQLSGTACSWCRDVSQTVYALPSNVPFHERDACSVAPVLDD